MVYTLANNAISSLSIAIEYFKKLFYHDQEYSASEIDEAFKISIVFLENAMELLLKTILVEDDPLSIYCRSDSLIEKLNIPVVVSCKEVNNGIFANHILNNRLANVRIRFSMPEKRTILEPTIPVIVACSSGSVDINEHIVLVKVFGIACKPISPNWKWIKLKNIKNIFPRIFLTNHKAGICHMIIS